MKRLSVFILYTILSALSLWAVDIKVTAQAPSVVAVDEQVRLQYTVNSNKVKNFKKIW